GGIAGGCAVPGVMAARTLRSPRERLATLLTVSFMNCGAKLPVLALLTATFFSSNQAQLMFLLTLLAWAVALTAAKFLRLTVLRGESTPFVMELPPYRFPTFRGLLIHTWERTWQYIKKAGTTILAISILIWAMMTFPGLPTSEKENFARQRQEIMATASTQAAEAREKADSPLSAQALQLKEKLTAIDTAQAGSALRHSLAGRIGTSMEAVSWLPGFDWRTNIALVGGFAAKEVIVSTLGTAYSLGEADEEDNTSLSETLAKDPNWNPVVALSLIVFVMFYAPCFVTVVCISRESGSWKWGLFSICFNTAFAFLLATLVYQGGRALGFAG
ncbi:MAG: ferrous iron transporter B, partial [Desulfurivibrio sp.]|nr:ferrous iron transporter B [Desulfurivibrio sp.]